jgi:hypothetical protein
VAGGISGSSQLDCIPQGKAAYVEKLDTTVAGSGHWPGLLHEGAPFTSMTSKGVQAAQGESCRMDDTPALSGESELAAPSVAVTCRVWTESGRRVLV